VVQEVVVGVGGDAAIRGLVGDQVEALVAGLLGGSAGAQAVGRILAGELVSLLANRDFDTGVAGILEAVFTGVLDFPGVTAALAGAAGRFATAVVAGDDILVTVEDLIAGLRADAAIQNAVGATIADVATALLSEPDTVRAFAATVDTVIVDLLDDAEVRSLIGGLVAELVSSVLGGGSENTAAAMAFSEAAVSFIAASDLGAESVRQLAAAAAGALSDTSAATVIGATIGDALVSLLATPGLVTGLGAAVSTAIVTLLDYPELGAVLGDASGEFARSLVAGADTATELQTLLQGLAADPTVLAALGSTITATLQVVDTAVLSDPAVQQALGTTATGVIIRLAGDPGVRELVGQLLGPPLAAVVEGLLADAVFVGSVAGTLGTAVTGLLSFPGVSTALTDTVAQFGTAVVNGTGVADALGAALSSLQSDAAFRSAVGVIVPGAVDAVLGDPQDRQALGRAAREAVIGLLGIQNGFLGAVVGQVTEGAVVSFLADPTSWRLVSRLGVDALTGTPVGDLAGLAIDLVLADPLMPRALGLAVGRGIGSLFGQNIVGAVIGDAIGIGATVLIALAFGVVNIVRAFTGNVATAPRTAAAVIATTVGDDFLGRVPNDGDFYLMRAVIGDWDDAEVLRRGIPADTRLVLTDVAVNEVDRADRTDQFLDVRMALDRGPRMVARFRLDALSVPAYTASR